MAIESSKLGTGSSALPDFIADLKDLGPKTSTHDQIKDAVSYYRYMPSVKTVIDTLSSMILTDVDVQVKSDKPERVLDILYKKLDILTLLRRVVVENLVTGNVFVSVLMPSDKQFKCPQCGKNILLSSYRDEDKYSVSQESYINLACSGCRGNITIAPSSIQNVESSMEWSTFVPDIRLFSPSQITLICAPGSSRKMVVYELTADEKKTITQGKYMFILKNTPMEFMRVAFQRDGDMSIKLDNETIHIHDSEISGRNDGWGVIPLMSAYQLIYYLSALRQQTLEMSAMRPSPVYLVSPQTGAEIADLDAVRTRIYNSFEDAHKNNKRQPVVFTPVPVNAQTLFADFKPLSLVGEIKLAQSELAVSLGIPSDLVYGGGAQWSAASANIRMMEKRFIFLYESIDKLCDKIAKVVGECTKSEISIRPVRLRVLDDMAVTQLLNNLNMRNRVSSDTLFDRLGIDFAEEAKKINGELKTTAEIDTKVAKAQANFQREQAQADVKDTAAFQSSMAGGGATALAQQALPGAGPEKLPPKKA
jgi:hypothetical protein